MNLNHLILILSFLDIIFADFKLGLEECVNEEVAVDAEKPRRLVHFLRPVRFRLFFSPLIRTNSSRNDFLREEGRIGPEFHSVYRVMAMKLFFQLRIYMVSPEKMPLFLVLESYLSCCAVPKNEFFFFFRNGTFYGTKTRFFGTPDIKRKERQEFLG